MSQARPFAELLFLAILATGACPNVHAGPGGTSRVQVAQVFLPVGPDLRLVNRTTLMDTTPLAYKSVDEARGGAVPKSSEDFSGGPTGTLLVAAALIGAAAIILGIVIPW